MIVIAVEHFDVHVCLGHTSGNLSELTWLSLIQSLHEHLALLQHTDAGCLECVAGGCSILEKKMRHALAVYNERAATLNANAGAAQRVTHLRQRAGSVVQSDRQVLHCRLQNSKLFFIDIIDDARGIISK